MDATRIEEVRKLVIETIKTVYDPEIPVDIYELGLIYNIDISPEGKVDIEMTLTSPGCPVAGSLPKEVELKIATIDDVSGVNIELVWDPPWTPEKMSEAARLDLNM
jgi:FeS assembly SUF system protein